MIKKSTAGQKMKAIILAAGKGTRMGDLTKSIPKPMLSVFGKPILEHIIMGIADAGIKEIFIVVGHRSEIITNYFGDGSKWGLTIAYGEQTVQDGTGKAPEIARDFIGGSPFLLTYGDILVKPETYTKMVQRHAKTDSPNLLTVVAGKDVTKGGVIFFDQDFNMKRLVEKPSLTQLEELKREGLITEGDTVWYNAGIYIFEPHIFEFTRQLVKSPRGEYELTDAIAMLVNAKHGVAGMEIEGRWVDVRDPEVLAQLMGETY